MIKEKIEQILGRKVVLVHPKDLRNGDYTLIADVETAEEDFNKLEANKPDFIERIEFVKPSSTSASLGGPRFINFYLSKKFFANSLKNIIEKGNSFGKGEHAKGLEVLIEHTDPNLFKEFHIGHLMPNVIGSTIARLCEWNGAKIAQVCYQGDVGLHVAKTLWALGEEKPGPSEVANGKRMGLAYVKGNSAYEEDVQARKEIIELNKKIYSKDEQIFSYYDLWRNASLAYFEVVYDLLSTNFDYKFFESGTAVEGKMIVKENLGKIFEISDGAIVFKAEKYDPTLHTRVFINSEDIPTYEAKELGLAKIKDEKYHPDLSIVVTGNEINDYFRVLLMVMKQIFPNLARITKHISHGMLRLSDGKMSSRKGTIIPLLGIEGLYQKVVDQLYKTNIEKPKFKKTNDPITDLVEEIKGFYGPVAMGAIKYMILRSTIGSNIIFDFEKSVSTEGDSGVYLQYAHARACSVIEKAGNGNGNGDEGETRDIERLLYRFPEIIERAGKDYAPNYITTYLTELAAAFNNFYAHEQISGHAYRLAIAKAFKTVMKNGLTVLGIAAPQKM